MCKVILNELFKHSLQKAPYHSLWQFKYEKYFSETSMATLNIRGITGKISVNSLQLEFSFYHINKYMIRYFYGLPTASRISFKFLLWQYMTIYTLTPS